MGIILPVIIIIITLSEALGQFLLSKHYNISQNKTHYHGIPIKFLPLITWLLYGICTYLLLISYKYTSMSKAEVYWDALSALIVPVIGAMFFGNTINVVGWCGIVLIILGTLLVAGEKKIYKLIKQRILN
jgi:multidrug transporter EmrE-like cation transporter